MDWKQRTIQIANEWGIDPAIAVAQIQQESGFNPRASSGVAYGLAQFTPATWQTYGNGRDIYDPEASLQAWAWYMWDLLNRFGWDYRLALAGYHSGAGNAQAALNNPAGNPKTNHYVNTILANAGKAGFSAQVSADGNSVSAQASIDSQTILYLALAGVLLFFLLD